MSAVQEPLVLGPSRVVTIGDATLYLGDCRDILPTIASGSVVMIWTDPPYGNNNADGDFLSNIGKILGNDSVTTQEPIANDDPESMRSVVGFTLDEAARILRPESCCCVCCCGGGGPTPTFAWLAQRMDERGLSFFHSVIWDKLCPGIGWRYRRQHEMIMVAHRAGGKLAWNEAAQPTPNIIRLAKPKNNEHPNVKPVDLIERFVCSHTEIGDCVLDPFMGSGSTGVACANWGRNFIGVELDPRYFDIACRRIEDAQRQARMFE